MLKKVNKNAVNILKINPFKKFTIKRAKSKKVPKLRLANTKKAKKNMRKKKAVETILTPQERGFKDTLEMKEYEKHCSFIPKLITSSLERKSKVKPR